MGNKYAVPIHVTNSVYPAPAATAWLLTPAQPDLHLTELSVTLALSDYSLYVYNAIVDLYRVAVLGTATGTAFTPVPVNCPDGRPALSTAVVNLTTEPTSVNVIKTWTLKPQDMISLQWEDGNGPVASYNSGFALGLRVQAQGNSATDVNIRTYVEFGE